MTEGNAVSKRSTRIFTEEHHEHHIMDIKKGVQSTNELQVGSYGEEKCLEDSKRESWSSNSSSKNTDLRKGSISDIGMDYGLLSNSVDGCEHEVTKSLQAVKPKAKEEGKPLNFGVVLPGMIYRSSFPQTEDFQFLQSLGLKTIVSLVNKDFPPEFKAFMKGQGINHRVVDMAGTKKVEISETIMNSIMEIALDKENYPLLIHCNHGKHRTGCAVAVIRHAYGWAVDTIVAEYEGYAEPKLRECDVKYITEYQISTLRAITAKVEHTHEIRPVLLTPRMTRFLLMAAIALSIWLTTIMCSPYLF
ncbi:tyrosine phosphatase family-domain-containing protein [Halenospora varia]|nr:tyrosine phosphatase family-domain-containing protein [Halenospora varia]